MKKIVVPSPEFFISQPIETQERLPKPFKEGETLPAFRGADGALMAWSSSLPLPAIGEKIYVTMNGIGFATVHGYFREHGGEIWFLGLMIKPVDPPKFYLDNVMRSRKDPKASQWRKDGLGCVFGSEIGNPRVTKVGG